jgi:hypothetical protein
MNNGAAVQKLLSLSGLLFVLAGCVSTAGMQSTNEAAHQLDAISSSGTILYVSAAGSGSACSPSVPCALETARSLVEQLTSTMTEDITISLAGGTDELAQPLSFGPGDSGVNDHFVNYTASAGAQPILSGENLIQGWTLADSSKGIYPASVPAGFDTRQCKQLQIAHVPHQINPAHGTTLGTYRQSRPFICRILDVLTHRRAHKTTRLIAGAFVGIHPTRMGTSLRAFVREVAP